MLQTTWHSNFNNILLSILTAYIWMPVDGLLGVEPFLWNNKTLTELKIKLRANYICFSDHFYISICKTTLAFVRWQI